MMPLWNDIVFYIIKLYGETSTVPNSDRPCKYICNVMGSNLWNLSSLKDFRYNKNRIVSYDTKLPALPTESLSICTLSSHLGVPWP